MPVLNKVSPLLSHPSVRAVLSEKEPLDLRSVLDTPGSVLLCALACDRLHGLAGQFASLIVSAIENAIMQRVDQPELNRNPVHLYLDEFQNLQSSAFESIIAEGRRFRLGLTLSHQNLNQIDRRLHHVIANNAATRIYFRTGLLDATELGRELAGYGARRPVEQLLNMPVGEAFVVDQRGEARRVHFNKARNEMASQKQTQVLLDALAQRSRRVHYQVSQENISSGVQHVRRPRAAVSKEASA